MSATSSSNDKLADLGYLSEWLLHDVRWRRFGFELELQFNNVFDDSGGVRADVLDDPDLVAVRLFGVQSLSVANHLSSAMLDEPELIDWGLSEIARVVLRDVALADRDGVKFDVLWEGPRHIEIVAASINVALMGQSRFVT